MTTQKSKVKRQNLNFKVLVLTFAFFVLNFTAASAQSPSPDAVRDAVKQKVDAEVAAIKSTVSQKAYVGQIKTKSDLTLTITNLAGEARTANLTTDAAIKLTGGKDGTAADVKVGDYVIAMGDADGSGVLTIKRLVEVTKPTPEDRKVIFGIVSKATATLLTFTDNSTLKITKPVADVTAGSKIIAVTRGTTTLLVSIIK